MTATTFDIRAFNRNNGDVAGALLGALDEHVLTQREEAVSVREEDVSRRERAIDRVERMHVLKGLSGQPIPIPATVVPSAHQVEVHAALLALPEPAPAPAPAPVLAPVAHEAGAMEPKPVESRRLSFQDAFKLRELEWWTKVLGAVPTLPA